MKSLSLKTVGALCAAASIASVACAALAQDGGPQGGPPGGFRGGGRPGAMMGDPAQRAQMLHERLQITPAQEAAFNAWQAAVKPSAPPQGRPGEAMRNMNTVQRLDQEVTLAAQRDAALKARVAATTTFYNQLSPAQKQTMDQLPPQALLALEGGMGGRGMGGPGGPGRPGGRGGPGGRRGAQGGGFDPNAGFGGQQPLGGRPPQ